MVWAVGWAVGCAGEPDGDDGSGVATAAEGSAEGSTDAGETTAPGEATNSSADGPADAGEESGGAANACPADADLDGMCPAQGEVCMDGDFACECLCGCDEGGGEPGEPGFYQCSYAREHVVQPVSASVTLDCAAGTIASTASFVLDNVDGHDAVELVLREQKVYGLATPGGEQATCAALCGPGQACPEVFTTVLEPGAMQMHAQEFGPSACEEDLCTFCGGTATFYTDWNLATGGRTDSAGATFQDVEIVCTP